MAGGLFAYMAAGAAEQVGKSMAEQAKALRDQAREDRIWERQAAFQREQNATEQGFRTSERLASQDYQSRENEVARRAGATEAQKERDARAAEADKTRQAGGSNVTMEDGTTGYQVGGKVTPLLGPDGKPIKIAGKAADDPADVSTIKFLVEKGVAKDYAEAARIVMSKSGSAQVTMSDIEEMTEKAVKTEFDGAITQPKPEDVAASRERNRTRIMKNLGLDENGAPVAASGDREAAGAPAARTGKGDRASGTSTAPARPEGMSDAQLIESAKAAVSRGAPAETVKARLKSYGIDPSKAGL